MKALTVPLTELADYQEMIRIRTKEYGVLQITGCVNSQKTHLMYALGQGIRFRLGIYSSDEKAKQAYEEHRFLEENTYYYPAKDLLFYHADIKGKYLLSQRMEVVRALMELEEEREITVLTTADALLDGLPPMKKLAKYKVQIAVGDILDFTELQEELVSMGYEREAEIAGPGQFAVRGGILDLYPLTEEFPIRVELWGDEVDSIRSFDVESQRSIENLQSAVIYPAAELELEQGEHASFLDYFPKEETLMFLDEPIRLLERMDEAEEEYRESLKNREAMEMEAETAALSQVFSVEEVTAKINRRYGIAFTMLESKCGNFHLRKTYSIQTKSVNPYNNSFEMLTRDLKRLKRSGYRVVLLSGSRTRSKRLAEDLRDYDLSSFYSEDADREVQEGEILVSYGHVTEGYEYPMLKFMVISETDIFGRKEKAA